MSSVDTAHALAVGSPTRPAAIRALRQWLIDAGCAGSDDDDALALMGQLTYAMTPVDPKSLHPDTLANQPDVTLLFDPETDAAFLFGPA